MSALGIDIVVTAARDAQARAYGACLAERQRRQALPAGSRWHVVTDPGGRRAGSGTATALAIRTVLGSSRLPRLADLRHRRIVIIHSGGDSKRLPAFAALGKAFAPLPTGCAVRGDTTVFDCVLADLLALPDSDEGGVFVASGDAVVGAGGESIDCSGTGVVGIAQRGSVERGSRHGVYVVGSGSRGRSNRVPVRDFLQKPSAERARAAGAIRADGTLLVDTGIVRFSPDATIALMAAFRPIGRGRGLIEAVAAGKVRPIDLYEHVLTGLVPGLRRAEFLRRLRIADTDPDAGQLDRLREALGDVGFSVRESVTDGFLHLGSTREYLDLLLRDRATSLRYGLSPPGPALRQVASHACRVELARGKRSAVVGCLKATLGLGGDNLAVAVPASAGPVALPRGFGCVALPIDRHAWAAVLFHVDDDAKGHLDERLRWAGTTFGAWCRRTGAVVAPDLRTLPHGALPTMWEAKLWRVGKRPLIERWMFGGERPSGEALRAKRHSIAELLERVDPDRLLALDRTIRRERFLADPASALFGDDKLGAHHVAALAERGRLSVLRQALLRPMKGTAPLGKARCLAVAGRLSGAADARRLRRQALAAVGEAIAEEIELPKELVPAAIRPDETVWTSAPARIDLAGGWSDTPPICYERGGSVVNLAVDLDNHPPVNAIAKLADEPVITIHSVDLGEGRTIRSSAELFAHSDPRDWSALAKAALRVAGIAPPAPSVPLARWLKRFGGGLSLSMLAAVPKGSGLGTSSILGATVLACLDRVVGRNVSTDELIARTSLLEQMIATRGGWQDQVGGIVPGLKITRSQPGARQRPVIESVEMPVEFKRELLARTVLCYTGRRRMARDILERVVERYLVRDPGVLEVVDRLKEGAERLGIAAGCGDIDRFAHEVSSYWRLKTTLDPLAMTAEIAAMADGVRRETLAWTLPGAGGGGFLFFIARDAKCAERIRAHFRTRPPHPLARVVEWSIAERGLRSGSV
jgi:fucokinase